jgi:phage terminase Nu1 subunit (DNA packaging protein)
MDSEIASAALQRLLGINKSVLGGLAAKGIAVWGNKRGSYRVETITRYCEHLREMASARGCERAEDARARLGQAQASLTEARAAALRGETSATAEDGAFWRGMLRAFRNGGPHKRSRSIIGEPRPLVVGLLRAGYVAGKGW